MADILVVCTANVARSPLFATRLQLEADNRLGPGAVTVDSAGIEAIFGVPAAAGSCEVSARWDRPLDDHTATPIAYHDMDHVDLILTMESSHRRAITGRNPTARPRTFTVREFLGIVSDRLPATDLSTLPPSDPHDPSRRLAAVVELADVRRPRRLPRRHADYPDPIGSGQQVYDGLGEEFTRGAATLAAVLFGPVTD